MSGELAKALVAAQREMPAVDKTGKSNFGAHITLDHLIASTRKHLQAHGLAIAQFPSVSEAGQPLLRTTLMHESGESMSADAPLFLGEKHTMQALGSALTYSRRQGWAAVLGISTEDDDDADGISLDKGKTAAAKPAPAAKTAAKEKTPEGVAGLSTEDLVKTHDRLAVDWGKLEAGFTPADAVTERVKKLAEAKAAGDPAPYRKWLTEQIGGYGVLIKEREAQASAAEAFPIPAVAKAA